MKLLIRKDIDVTEFDEYGKLVLGYLPECRDWAMPVRRLLGEVFG